MGLARARRGLDQACAHQLVEGVVERFRLDPAYQVGDTVLFQGKAYVSTFAPNWWSPAAAPGYWRETTCAGSAAGS